jgi:hypothetical protein
MGLMDFIKGQLIDIIEWTDDSRDTLSFRYPDEDKEIKRGAQLIVRESQVAQFVYLGQFGDTFGPGKYTLNTDNIPVLTSLKGWKYGFESPFKADVYYVVTRVFTGNKWGTSNPVMMRDADFGIVRLRLRHHRLPHRPAAAVPEGSGRHRSALPPRRVCRRDAVAPRQRVQRRPGEREGPGARCGDALLGARRRAAAADQPGDRRECGLEMTSFILENVSVPPEVERPSTSDRAWPRSATSTTT